MGAGGSSRQPVNTGLIIFARMGSNRLPGKALQKIGSTPLLGWVVQRAQRVLAKPVIVIATTTLTEDDAIADFAIDSAIPLFRGASEDVATRALACAEHYGFDRFVRVCGDSPFFQPEIVRQLLDQHAEKKLDIATNVFPRTFPAGTSVEIITTAALRRVLSGDIDANDREHMTQYFYRHPDDFTIGNLVSPNDGYANVSLAVDTEEDLERSRWIVKQLRETVETASLEVLVKLSQMWIASKQNPSQSHSNVTRDQ